MLETYRGVRVLSLEKIVENHPSSSAAGTAATAIELESLAASLPLTKNANIDTRLGLSLARLARREERLLFRCRVSGAGDARVPAGAGFSGVHTPK
jgi:hypothetical protein